MNSSLMDSNYGRGKPQLEPSKVGRLKVEDADHWPLTRQWILWYKEVGLDVGEGYKRVLGVKTIHQFWALYAFIHRPQQLQANSAYFFFKDGFPGQDSSSICCRIIYNGSTSPGQPNKISEYWQRAMIAVAGEQFEKFSSDVCGVSITPKMGSRYQLILWVCNVLDASQSVKCRFKEILGLPEGSLFDLEVMEDEADANTSLATYQINRTNKWLDENRDMQAPQKETNFRLGVFSGSGAMCGARPASSAVLIILGFDPKNVNCDKLYNLFSSYGRCLRVFFLLCPNYSECHVEMADSSDASCALQHLSGCALGRTNLFIKRCFVGGRVYQPKYPFNMPDKSSSFKDFSNCRVVKSEFKPSKREGPSSRLCFYNTPASLKNTTIWELLDCFHLRPKSVVISNIGEETSAGFIIFKSQDDAMETLMLANNYRIVDPADQREYTIQLFFGQFD